MTKEYGCAYWHDHVDEATALISAGPTETFATCTALCMANPLCESVKWTEFAMTVSECKLYSQSWDTNDKTCSIPDVIGGRKCHRQGYPLESDKSIGSKSLEIPYQRTRMRTIVL